MLRASARGPGGCGRGGADRAASPPGAAAASRRSARPDTLRHGVHGPERRPRGRGQPAGAGQRHRGRDRCRGPAGPRRRPPLVRVARDTTRCEPPSPGATTTSCCSRSPAGRRPVADRHPAGPRRRRHPYRRADRVPCYPREERPRPSRCLPGSPTSMRRPRPCVRFQDQLARAAPPHPRYAAADGFGLCPGGVFRLLPLLGLHTVLGLIVAFALNLNRVAVLLGVYSNLPWILVRLLHAHDVARRGHPADRAAARRSRTARRRPRGRVLERSSGRRRSR